MTQNTVSLGICPVCTRKECLLLLLVSFSILVGSSLLIVLFKPSISFLFCFVILSITEKGMLKYCNNYGVPYLFRSTNFCFMYYNTICRCINVSDYDVFMNWNYEMAVFILINILDDLKATLIFIRWYIFFHPFTFNSVFMFKVYFLYAVYSWVLGFLKKSNLTISFNWGFLIIVSVLWSCWA